MKSNWHIDKKTNRNTKLSMATLAILRAVADGKHFLCELNYAYHRAGYGSGPCPGVKLYNYAMATNTKLRKLCGLDYDVTYHKSDIAPGVLRREYHARTQPASTALLEKTTARGPHGNMQHKYTLTALGQAYLEKYKDVEVPEYCYVLKGEYGPVEREQANGRPLCCDADGNELDC